MSTNYFSTNGTHIGKASASSYKDYNGIKHTILFTWAINPEQLNKYRFIIGDIIGDHKERHTIKEFKTFLKEKCLIQHFWLIGEEFC